MAEVKITICLKPDEDIHGSLDRALAAVKKAKEDYRVFDIKASIEVYEQ